MNSETSHPWRNDVIQSQKNVPTGLLAELQLVRDAAHDSVTASMQSRFGPKYAMQDHQRDMHFDKCLDELKIEDLRQALLLGARDRSCTHVQLLLRSSILEPDPATFSWLMQQLQDEGFNPLFPAAYLGNGRSDTPFVSLCVFTYEEVMTVLA